MLEKCPQCPQCPQCDGRHVTEELREHSFSYGETGSFSCQILILKCTCGALWLDERAEEACELAMFRYEKSLHVRRTVFTNDKERALWERA